MSKRNKGKRNFMTGQRLTRTGGAGKGNAQNINSEEDMLVDVAGQIKTVEEYIEHHRKTILAILGIIALGVAAWVWYTQFYQKPKQAAATEKIQYAQNYFDQAKYEYALDGDTLDTDAGFLDIIDNFSGTPSANLAKYYAGISYLNLGNYDMAVSFLNDYSNTGAIIDSYKYGALGDAYSELGDNDKALSAYKKATTTQINEAATPYHLWKLGLFLETQGNATAAKDAYSKITTEYPNSLQASDAKKYLARVK